MTQPLTSEKVWKELRRELFAVLGMVNSRGQARTVGVMYIVQDRKIYISTQKDEWKTRHVQNNPHISITVPISKSIPFMSWIKIPAATITFSGEAQVFEARNVSGEIQHALLHGHESDQEKLSGLAIIEIEPQGEFVTYGIGIPLIQMSDPARAHGRAPVV